MIRARAAGDEGAAVEGVQVLLFKHEQRVLAWFNNKIGSKGPQVVEELAEVTLSDAIKSAVNFRGSDLRAFRGWLFRIARFRRADYLDKGRVEEVPLVADYDDEETERELTAGYPSDAIDEVGIFNQAFAELKKDSHKLVVLLGRLYGFPHKEVAERVNSQFGDALDDPMTESNVSKILSRFNKRVDELLDEAENPPPDDDDDD